MSTKSMLLNAIGGALSAIVFAIAAVTKFSQGAWVALLLIALLAFLAWRIRRHYDGVHHAVALYPLELSGRHDRIVPARLRTPDSDGSPATARRRRTRVPTSSST
ncbi:MAG: hypothetical protein LC721_12555 [Actinobacteria bacterium]|nr:hypothetical protein [Actinomycetota bacterium]